MGETVVGPEDEFHELAEEPPAALSEIHHPREMRHLRIGFYAQSGPSAGVGDSLPYNQLGGPGLERLCYLLLLDEGKVPRYFGKPGQEQYGIDLLVTEGDGTTVYQCKNEKSFPSGKMKEALQKFEAEWLGRPELPRPTKFVLCCPLPLQELGHNVAWTTREREFHDTTGTSVVFWDRHYLDECLRRLPDVVADLFSDEIAIQFCDVRDWNYDLFRPLVAGSGERTVERYLEIRDSGRLYVDPNREKNFSRKLERSGSLLIRGLPGTGKTVTGLALAESLRHGHDPYRIYYIDLRHDLDEDTLVKGVRRRLTRPTVFFLDDCHGKFELLDHVQNRLRPILAQRLGWGLLVFAARTTPTPEGIPRGDFSDFENRLAEEKAILEFRPTLRLFRPIITLAKSHFAGLSEARLEKVFEFTGHDLFLLDQLLETLESPRDIDRLTPGGLFEKTLIHYFGVPTVYRPGFMKLAALAQFDLAPPVASFGFDLEQEDERATGQLVVMAGRPLRYYFLHSSAAELVFRALAWNDHVDDHPALAADHLIAFFKSRPASDNRLVEDLDNVIHNRLRLKRDDTEENRLKSRFLADDSIYALIESSFEQLPLNSLAVCLIILQDTDDATFERYHNLVQRKVDDGPVLRMAMERPFWESSLFLRLVKSAYPALLCRLRAQLADRGLGSLVETTEFQNALALLASLSAPGDPWWVNSLDSVPTNEFTRMIRRTIDSGRSIGTINLALRELKKTDRALLEKLESKIGAERYLHLIAGAGTIFELFSIIQHSSASMAGELIEALDAETLDALITQTIASRRSIGTIDFALRDLKKTNQALLAKLERKMGAGRYLHLIAGTGTISNLFKIVEYSSLSMAGELIEALDAETLDGLVAQTIDSGRSIGTISLALRELKETERALLRKLERKIGVQRWWHLICANGTMRILCRILECMDGSFKQEMVRGVQSLSLAEWQALLSRGDFADLCSFVRWASLFFSAQFTAPFLDSLRPTFEMLIRRGGWQTLEKGAGLLKAAPKSSIKQELLDILDDYVATVTSSSLRFDSLGEAAACVSLLWHEIPSQRQELMHSLLTILPEEDVWYASAEFLRSARLLFFILADPRARQDDARRVLSIGDDEAVVPLCNKARTLDLVFYLWNLHSLWFQWGKEGEETFVDFLHPGISNAITDALARRIQGEMDEDERDLLVILAGFLSFSGLALALNRAAIADWVATLLSFEELQERALSKTFIPAALFLFGLERVFDREGGVPARTWRQVLPKAEAYSEKRSSLERLCDLVRARARV